MKTYSNLKGFITNQHVCLHAGHSLYIPGFSQSAFRVGVTRQVLEHRPDDVWLEGVDEPFAYVRTDSGFVVVEERLQALLKNEFLTVGTMPREPFRVDMHTTDIIGMPVRKIGRTTGIQRGVVVAFGHGISNVSEFLDRQVGVEPPNFYTDLLIAPRGDSEIFSARGDSGSPIVLDTGDARDNTPVGLLWGGRPTDIGRSRGLEDLTYGISLQRILDNLKVDLI